MKRIVYTLLFLSLSATYSSLASQVGARLDAEYFDFCLVDSIGPGQVVRFTRLVNIADPPGEGHRAVGGGLHR